MVLRLTEPSCRAGQIAAFRSAALELWGPWGWREVTEGLGQEARAALIDHAGPPVGWVAERHMVELAERVFEGPAQRLEEPYRRFVGVVIRQGFGRARRLLVRLAPPELLLRRAPELWNHDHTHGTLSIELGEHRAHATLRGYPPISSEVARLTAAESFRSALSLTSATDVVAKHDLVDDQLRVDFSWR